MSQHRVLRSGSIEETRAFLGHKNIGLRPRRHGSVTEDFDAVIDGTYLPRMYIAYMAYGIEVDMVGLAPNETDYAIHLPLGGWMKLLTGDHSVHCEPGFAVIASPARRNDLTASDRCGRLLISVARGALHRHLATILGEQPSELLVFQPEANPSRPGGRRLTNAVHYAAREFERKDAVAANPLVVAQFEELLMTLLLMEQPNNYSEALHRGPKGAQPRDVKRTIDYIHANLDQAILLEDLVAVSGVAGRTLAHHFKSFVGTSPMAYVKKARLERVRDELARLDGQGSVTEVAGRWGFANMGRFSSDYQRRFGELPSVTARRRKRSAD